MGQTEAKEVSRDHDAKSDALSETEKESVSTSETETEVKVESKEAKDGAQNENEDS